MQTEIKWCLIFAVLLWGEGEGPGCWWSVEAESREWGAAVASSGHLSSTNCWVAAAALSPSPVSPDVLITPVPLSCQSSSDNNHRPHQGEQQSPPVPDSLLTNWHNYLRRRALHKWTEREDVRLVSIESGSVTNLTCGLPYWIIKHFVLDHSRTLSLTFIAYFSFYI